MPEQELEPTMFPKPYLRERMAQGSRMVQSEAQFTKGIHSTIHSAAEIFEWCSNAAYVQLTKPNSSELGSYLLNDWLCQQNFSWYFCELTCKLLGTDGHRSLSTLLFFFAEMYLGLFLTAKIPRDGMEGISIT